MRTKENIATVMLAFAAPAITVLVIWGLTLLLTRDASPAAIRYTYLFF